MQKAHPIQERIEAAADIYGGFAKSAGVPLTRGEELDAIARLMAYRLLDDMVDGADDPVEGLQEYLINVDAIVDNDPDKITRDPEAKLGILATRFATWDDDFRHDQAFHFRRLGEVSADKRYARTARELRDIALLEGRHLASLFLPNRINPEAGEERNTDKFDHFIINAYLTAYMVDSAIDLPTDNREGTIKVPATLLNRAYLLANSIPFAARTLEAMSPAQQKDLGYILGASILRSSSRSPSASLAT